jgi:hypothetical protein
MNLSQAAFERNFADHTDKLCHETPSISEGQSFLARNVPRESPETIQQQYAQHFVDKLGSASTQPLCKMAIPKNNHLPKQTQASMLSTMAACLRLGGKKLRYSGQRPYGCCGTNDLDRIWDESEAGRKPKRHSRISKFAQGARDSRKATKSKEARVQVRSACTRCQHRKARCSGTRPACAYCIGRNLDCNYSVAEGATRTDDLKRRLRESLDKAYASGLVLEGMRKGTDDEAPAVLARLRMGESLREIICSLRVSSSSRISEFQLVLHRRMSTP